VLNASNSGVPVILDDHSDAGQAYQDMVGRYLGEELPHRFVDLPRKGFFSRLFGG
jgi:septum site-determining protein MinD